MSIYVVFHAECLAKKVLTQLQTTLTVVSVGQKRASYRSSFHVSNSIHVYPFSQMAREFPKLILQSEIVAYFRNLAFLFERIRLYKPVSERDR